MGSKKVFLICNGNNFRWSKSGGRGPKQLIVIRGKKLLDRIMNQVLGHNFSDVTLVSSSKELKSWAVVNRKRVKLFSPKLTKSVCETILMTRSLWGTTTESHIFILGDVYFSNNAFRKLVEVNEDPAITFIARKGVIRPWREAVGRGSKEIFAVVVDAGKLVEFKRGLASIVSVSSAGRSGGAGFQGKLWDLFYSLHDRKLRVVKDETDDFDTIKDVVGWKGAYSK